MKVKPFVIGDLHATNNLPYRKVVGLMNEGLFNLGTVLNKVRDRANDYKLKDYKKVLIIIGDVFHNYFYDPIAVDWVYANMIELSKSFDQIYIMKGNHDQLNETRHNLYFLKFASGEKNNITIFDYAASVHRYYGLGMVFVPFSSKNFVNQEKSILNAYREIKDTKIKMLFLHNDMKGAKFDNSIIAQQGFSMTKYAPNGKIGSKFDYVICGHMHRRQLIAGKNNVKKPTHIILGSPFQLSFSEKDQYKKGFCILNTKKKEVEFVDTNQIFFHVITVPVKNFSRYLNEELEKLGEKVKKSIIRVKLQCNESQLPLIQKVRNRIRVKLKKYDLEQLLFSIDVSKRKKRDLHLEKVSNNISRIQKYNKGNLSKLKHVKRLTKKMSRVYNEEK